MRTSRVGAHSASAISNGAYISSSVPSTTTSVPATWRPTAPVKAAGPVQRADGVEGGAAGGELVVDQHQHLTTGEQAGILRQQSVLGRMAVRLVEPGVGRHTGNRATSGMQVGRAERFRDAMTQPG